MMPTTTTIAPQELIPDSDCDRVIRQYTMYLSAEPRSGNNDLHVVSA